MDGRRPDLSTRRRSSARSANASGDTDASADAAPAEPGAGLRVRTTKDTAAGAAADGDKGNDDFPYALSFVLTPVEAYKVQAGFARLGVVRPPPLSRLNSSTNPPTPTPSYPSTPNVLPKGASPFIPMTTITSTIKPSDAAGAGPNSTAIKAKPFKPQVRLAVENAFDDSVLSLTSRLTIRSFLFGYAIQAVLTAILPGILRRKSPREAIGSLLSLANARVGTSFALFTFLYRSISYLLSFARLSALTSLPVLTQSSLTYASTRVRLLARLVRLLSGNGIVPFFSVLAASPALHILPSQTASKPGATTFPRKTFALDLFTKGLYHQYDALRKRQSSLVTWIPDWCDTTLLYAISNGQLLWAFLFEPDCFPKSYGDFVLARSAAYVPPRPEGLPSTIKWPSRRVIVDHVALLSTPSKSSTPFPEFKSPALSALTPSVHPTTPFADINPILDWSPAHPAHERLMCALLHPTEPSCRANYLNYWAKEWRQSAKFVAAFTAFFNLFKLQSWKRDPEGSLFRFVMSVAQGATVISGTIASAWALTCFFQQYLPRTFIPRTRFFFNGFLASVFLYAVPAARRAQMSLYVARLSMDSTWQVLRKQRKVKNVRNGDVFLLTIGLALLAGLYEDMPYVLSGYVKRVLRSIIGPRITGTAAAMAGLPINSIDKGPVWSPAPVDAAALDAKLQQNRVRSRSVRAGSESFFSQP